MLGRGAYKYITNLRDLDQHCKVLDERRGTEKGPDCFELFKTVVENPCSRHSGVEAYRSFWPYEQCTNLYNLSLDLMKKYRFNVFPLKFQKLDL